MKQALILAGGSDGAPMAEGRRSAARVGGRPLLVRLLDQLSRVGIEQAVLVAGPGERRPFMRALRGRPALVDLLIVLERRGQRPPGQPGALRAAGRFFTRPFLVVCADHVYDDRLIHAMARKAPPADYVYGLIESDPTRVIDPAGAIRLRLDGPLIVELGPDLDPFDAVSAGIYCATPRLFEVLAPDAEGRGPAEILAALRQLGEQGAVFAVATGGIPWCAVRTPASRAHATQLM